MISYPSGEAGHQDVWIHFLTSKRLETLFNIKTFGNSFVLTPTVTEMEAQCSPTAETRVNGNEAICQPMILCQCIAMSNCQLSNNGIMLNALREHFWRSQPIHCNDIVPMSNCPLSNNGIIC